MIESRRLRDPNDPFFEKWREWKKAYPRTFTAMDNLLGENEDLAEYAQSEEHVHVGVSENGAPLAIITFRHAGGGWFEIHLDSRRGFTMEQYAPVAWRWGWRLFELGAYAIYGWLLDSSRAARRAAEQLCLEYDGTVRWIGVYNGKIVRSKRYVLYRSTWMRF